jgi:hypothetical protein
MLPNGLPRLALVVALTASTGLHAAQWTLAPEISARLRYEDNYRLNTEDELSVWETALLPKLSFARSTETSRLAGIAGLNLRRFDEEGLDTNDRFFRFDSSHSTERSRWGLNAGYSRDTSLDTELVDEQELLNRVPRERLSLSPNWAHSLTETTGLNASYQYTDISYPDTTEVAQFTGYTYHSASVGASHRLSPTTRLITQISLSLSEREDDTLRSDNQQITLGLEHHFSERLSASAFVGSGRTETDFKQGFGFCDGEEVALPDFLFGPGRTICVDRDTGTIIPFTTVLTTVTSSSKNAVYSADLRYELETGELTLQASRSVTPYTNGGLALNDRFGLAGKHRFSSRLQGNLSLDWYRTSNSSDFGSSIDRTTTSVRPSLRWNLDRDWTLTGSYRYYRQDYEGRVQAATSNALELTLTYQWPRYAISR